MCTPAQISSEAKTSYNRFDANEYHLPVSIFYICLYLKTLPLQLTRFSSHLLAICQQYEIFEMLQWYNELKYKTELTRTTQRYVVMTNKKGEILKLQEWKLEKKRECNKLRVGGVSWERCSNLFFYIKVYLPSLEVKVPRFVYAAQCSKAIYYVHRPLTPSAGGDRYQRGLCDSRVWLNVVRNHSPSDRFEPAAFRFGNKRIDHKTTRNQFTWTILLCYSSDMSTNS